VSKLKIFQEILYILFGVMCIVFTFALELPAYVPLIGIGLIVWGVIDIRKELRDTKKGSEVDQLSKEREEIAKKLNKEG